jgi:chorismate mutase
LDEGFAGVERSEPVGRAKRNAGGAPAAGGLPAGRAERELSQELVDGALDRVRSRLPVGDLPDEVREQLTDGLIDELLSGKRGEAEILGPGGLLGDLTRRLVERCMEAKLSEHLGYEHSKAPPGGAGNSRNGAPGKTLLTDHGPVRIAAPRDRNGTFEPQIVAKKQRRLAGLDEKIIALYAGGMTTREIETYISELYGPGVGRDTVSRVTAAVLEDAKAWQTRPLEAVYPIVYLDALVVKIRDGQAVRNFACYLAIGVNTEGERDVLGIWFQRTEGAKFWLQVLTELKQRGVGDVLVCCVDGTRAGLSSSSGQGAILDVMSKRAQQRRRHQPAALRAPVPRHASPAGEPERLLLDQIAQGALDPHLTAIAQAIRARYELLQMVSSAKALAQLTVGDAVRINHHARPRYLQALHGRVIELDDQSATICLHRPVGRFRSGQVRCPPLALDKQRQAA